MDKGNGSSDQRERIREHVRTMLRKLSALQRANREAGRNPTGSAQERIKSDREQDRS